MPQRIFAKKQKFVFKGTQRDVMISFVLFIIHNSPRKYSMSIIRALKLYLAHCASTESAVNRRVAQ